MSKMQIEKDNKKWNNNSKAKKTTVVLSCMSAILLFGITIAGIVILPPVQASSTPFYITGDHTAKATVKFENDCWHEIYARLTPKNNNGVLLNKQTIPNNDEPDNGPSETVYLKWKFKGAKFDSTSSTNEGRARLYVKIELTESITGETVTKYQAVSTDQSTWDFGTYFMHTDSSLCDH